MGHQQAGPQPEQQHAAAAVQQMGAGLHHLGREQTLAVGQGLDVLAGDLVHHLPRAVVGGQLGFGVAAAVAQGGQLGHQGAAQLLVPLEAHRPADPHHAGRAGEGALRQLADGEQGGFLGVVDDVAGDLLFGGAEGRAGLPQAEQGVFHGGLPVLIVYNAQKFSRYGLNLSKKPGS